MRVFAATLMQAHARRKKECAECEAARTQERLQDVYRLANVQMEAAQNAVEVERITTKFRDQHMTIRDPIDGSIVTLDQAIRFMIDAELPRLERERAHERDERTVYARARLRPAGEGGFGHRGVFEH